MKWDRAHLDEQVKQLVREWLGDIEPDHKVLERGRRSLGVLQHCLYHEFDLFEQQGVVRRRGEDRHIAEKGGDDMELAWSQEERSESERSRSTCTPDLVRWRAALQVIRVVPCGGKCGWRVQTWVRAKCGVTAKSEHL